MILVKIKIHLNLVFLQKVFKEDACQKKIKISLNLNSSKVYMIQYYNTTKILHFDRGVKPPSFCSHDTFYCVLQNITWL